MNRLISSVLLAITILLAFLLFSTNQSEPQIILTEEQAIVSPMSTGFIIKELNGGKVCEEVSGTSFIVFGDTQPKSEPERLLSQQVINQISKTPHDFVIHTGDHVEEGSSEEEWKAYFDLIKPIYKEGKYFAVRGNHDNDEIMWEKYWDSTNDQNYFSFDKDNIHFMILDNIYSSYFGGPLEADQKAWLEKDLEKCKSAEFCFTFMHVPLVSWKSGDTTKDTTILPLLESKGVDAIFAGHVHTYERGNVEDVGYLTSGGGGNKFHTPETGVLASFPYEDKEITKTNNFIRITFNEDRAVGCVYSKEGKQIDSFEILKR